MIKTKPSLVKSSIAPKCTLIVCANSSLMDHQGTTSRHPRAWQLYDPAAAPAVKGILPGGVSRPHRPHISSDFLSIRAASDSSFMAIKAPLAGWRSRSEIVKVEDAINFQLKYFYYTFHLIVDYGFARSSGWGQGLMMIRVLVAEPGPGQVPSFQYGKSRCDGIQVSRARDVNSNLERYFLPARFDIAVAANWTIMFASVGQRPSRNNVIVRIPSGNESGLHIKK